MRFAGRITEWHDEKGYGFITPNGGGERVFVHVRAIERGAGRPAEGLALTYVVRKDERGRSNAVDARRAGAARKPDQPRARRSRLPKAALGLGSLVVLAGGAWFVGLPLFVSLVYVAMSLATFAAYALDKSAAQADRRRIPESTLHLFSLLGGWPGALVAQQWLRHKSVKAEFLGMFWLTVFANLGLAVWLLTRL